ncbi:MAG: hypothetical protein GY859_26695 [Desulfobacterales bacterium]|nr:hypothetical protein [Desulfobacterales bacterium]
MTREKDIVLIYFEDRPLVFARVEAIDPDIKRGWQQVRLLMLQVPLQVVTWILRDAYIDGDEFTMNGKRMRLEKVEAPETPEAAPESNSSEKEDKKPLPPDGAKVISFADLKKK